MNLLITFDLGNHSLLVRAVSNRGVLSLHMILEVIVKRDLPHLTLLTVEES